MRRKRRRKQRRMRRAARRETHHHRAVACRERKKRGCRRGGRHIGWNLPAEHRSFLFATDTVWITPKRIHRRELLRKWEAAPHPLTALQCHFSFLFVFSKRIEDEKASRRGIGHQCHGRGSPKPLIIRRVIRDWEGHFMQRDQFLQLELLHTPTKLYGDVYGVP